jgi:hypothetical protein
MLRLRLLTLPAGVHRRGARSGSAAILKFIQAPANRKLKMVQKLNRDEAFRNLHKKYRR